MAFFLCCTATVACAEADNVTGGSSPDGGNSNEAGGGESPGDGGNGAGVLQGGDPTQGGGAQGAGDQGGGDTGGAAGGGGVVIEPGANGSNCEADSDCDGGLCLSEVLAGVPGGQCSQDCTDTGTCTEAGSVCGYNPSGFGSCIRECDPNTPDACGTTPATIYCYPNPNFNLGGLCFGVCNANDDCTIEGATCDESPNGYCLAPEDCATPGDEDSDGYADCNDGDCAASATCTDACTDAIIAGATQTGNTSTGTQLYDGDCAATAGSGGEVIYTYTAAAAGPYRFTLQSATDQGLHARTTCSDPGTEIDCIDASTTADEILILDLAANQTITLFVDAYAPGDEGPFTLLIEPAVEDCDSTVDDDGDNLVDCDDADCATFGACQTACTGAIAAQTTNTNTTVGKPALFESTCGSSGNEVLYTYTAAATGIVRFRLENASDHVLHFRTTCADGSTEITCVDDSGLEDELVDLPLTQGQTITILVDAYDSFEAGAFTLHVTPAAAEDCADGIDQDFDLDIDCADADCTGNAACVPGAGAIGATCTTNTQCASSTGGDPVCAKLALAPGYNINANFCTEWCDLTTDDCPTGTECVDIGFNQGICQTSCVDDGDCATGFFCSSGCVPNPPAGWGGGCDISYYNDGGCDCGCGIVDVDCADATVDSCEFCSFGCSSTSCPGTINPTNNATCQ